MSRYHHNKTTHELEPIAGYGSRIATSIDGKTLTVHSSLLNIDGYNYGSGDIGAAINMIATIESGMVATKDYDAGECFVYNAILYVVTEDVFEDDEFVIGENCELAPNLSDQINAGKAQTAIVANQLAVDNTKFYFDSHDGKYGYNTSAARGADTFVPFSNSSIEYIAMYGAQSSSATNASVTSHTFAKDYKKVIIIMFSSDTDNNGDNWFKVFNAQQSGTAWSNFNNVMTGAWKKIGPTTDFIKTTLPDGWAITMNGYANDADKNKTITAGVAGGGNGFFTIFEKDDVEKDEVAWMYYNTYGRACIIMLGMTA